MTWNKPSEGNRSFTVRFGLFSLLLIREISYYLVTQFTLLVVTFVLTRFPNSPLDLARLIFFQYPVSAWFFIIRYVQRLLYRSKDRYLTRYPSSVVCLIATLLITASVRSEFVSRRMIIAFSVLYPIYLTFFAIVGLYGHARQLIRYSSWNPTARS